MAYAATAAVLTAVRGVLESAEGTLRTIAATRFHGGLPEGLDGSEESLRALERARCEPFVRVVGPHATNFVANSNLHLLDVEVTVRVARHLGPEHRLTDATRDTVIALAAEDADVIRQALTYPGNLTQTSGGTATNLVSNLLTYEGSDDPRIEYDDADSSEGGRVITVHRFTGIVKVTQAVS